MRYLIITLFVFAFAFIFVGCEGGGGEPEVEIEKIANDAPADKPDELKDAETAYQYMVEKWVEGDYENLYLVLDAQSVTFIGDSWNTYIRARDIAYDAMGEEAEAYFAEESVHGEILLLEGVQPYFGYILESSGTNAIILDEDIKAEGFKLISAEPVEGDETKMVFESNFLGDPFTMYKEGDYWVTDYWMNNCMDTLGQSDIALDDISNDAPKW